MNFTRVIDFEDGTIQIFHYEVVPNASARKQVRSRMNADTLSAICRTIHTPEDHAHENSIFKSLSNNSYSQSNKILDGTEGTPERSRRNEK